MIKSSKAKVFTIEEGEQNKRRISADKSELAARQGGIGANVTLVNLLKGMVGAGVFSLPLALKYAGLWAGFILVFLFGIITAISMDKLVKCSQFLALEKDCRSLDYGQMTAQAFKTSYPKLKKFAPAARAFVNASLISLQVGVCSVYYVFVAEHVREVAGFILGKTLARSNLYLLAVFAPFILLASVRNIRHISIFSLIGNVLMGISLIIILRALVMAPHITATLPAYTDFSGIIAASGSVLYAFEGQGIVLPLENKLKHPSEMREWTGVLPTGMAIVTLLYAGCGFFGYVTYGEAVEGSVTLNLPDTPANVLVKALLGIVVYTGYAVQQFVVIELSLPTLRRWVGQVKGKRVLVAEYTLRYAIVATTLLLALLVPNLEDIIPLIGVTAGMTIAMIIPPIVETVVFLPIWMETSHWCTTSFHIAVNLLIFGIGAIFIITGVYSNLSRIASEGS